MYNRVTERGLIAWFVANPVAANLLMLVIIAGGLLAAITIHKKTLPDFVSNTISITVPFPGAGPAEVEQGVVMKLEEVLSTLKGVKQITSVSSDGSGRINVRAHDDADMDRLLEELKLRVDAVAMLPDRAEKPIIERREFRTQVLWLSLYGDVNPHLLKELARGVRDDLLQMSEIDEVNAVGMEPYEIVIEVQEETLHEYGLSIDDIVTAVRAGSLNTTTGSVKAESGRILLRTSGQAYTQAEFEGLVIRSHSDGSRLHLGAIARVLDGFEESTRYARFKGKPSVNLQVMSSLSASDTQVAAAVKSYVASRQLPQGVSLAAWSDVSRHLQGRLDMMLSNLGMGAVLVFVVLALFLRLRVAFWVVASIPVSILGALWLMETDSVGVTVNLISLFAFILVLGIVVDDAIIIGESVYERVQRDGYSADNVIRGARAVAVPATFGVLTTVAAFVPLLSVYGPLRPFFATVSIVVILCLAFSLLESKLILPAHLAGMPKESDGGKASRFSRLQGAVQEKLDQFVQAAYRPFLERVVRVPGLSLSLFAAVLIVTIGLMGSRLLSYEFYPTVPSDFIRVTLALTEGGSPAYRDRILGRINAELQKLNAEHSGATPLLEQQLIVATDDTHGEFIVELSEPSARSIDAMTLVEQWRAAVGTFPGVKELRFIGSTNTGGGAPIDFRLSHPDAHQLQMASDEFMAGLAAYDGVVNVLSDSGYGRRELLLELRPLAESNGVTRQALARQVRQAFYGEEAQRVQRGRDEVKVMVRYPHAARRSIAELDSMWIQNADGELLPLGEIANAEQGITWSEIRRSDLKRAVTIQADVDAAKITSREVIRDVKRDLAPSLQKKYPGLQVVQGGASAEQTDSLGALGLSALVGLFMIYCLMAVSLRSYRQPLLILAVLPFGIVGAVLGHVLLGKAMSMMSVLGLIALTGVVVNDSIVLMDCINRMRREGTRLARVVVAASCNRFRAIVLTSVTTFAGLLPIMFETSLQAQFVIPMAISLGFGVLCASVVTLVLLPLLVSLAGRCSRSKMDEQACAVSSIGV